MSTPMTASQLEAQLKKWAINYAPYKPDWATHNRGQRGKGWGNVHGVVIHHTGTDGDARQDLYAGDSALPGPKVQLYIDKNGKLWLIGWGRANHAGGGDPAVLNHVINEDYSGILTTRYGEGDSYAEDGNAYFYGIEVGYSGSHEMSPAQYSTLMKVCAAIADFHNWTEKSFIAHYEWNKYKWDPGCGPNSKKYNMVGVRGDIKHAISAGPKGTGNVSETKPSKPQTYKDVWDADFMTPPQGYANTANPTWAPNTVLRWTAERADEINKKLDKIMAHLNIK